MKRRLRHGLVALGVVLVALWLAFLRPAALGGSTEYVIVSGTSMEPTLYADDLVVVRERDRYDIGDIVAMHVPEGAAGPVDVVIHRIVGGNASEGYVTQGDNRRTQDEWRVTPNDILGARLVRIPKAGMVLGWLAEPFVLGVAVGAAVTSLVWTVRTRTRPAVATAATAAPLEPASTDVDTAPPPVAPAPLRPANTATAAASGGTHRHRPGASPRDVADRIRHRYEHATDPETRLQIRQTVFELAATFASEDPDFDAAAFLRACGAHAYDVDATAQRHHQR